MLKKVILFLATFAIIAIAYTIYEWRDDTPIRVDPPMTASSDPAVPATQPVAGGAATLSIREAKIPPGESPKVTVLDERGNARIVFQSTRWQAVRDNAFHVTQPMARLLLPSGQLAYVWADEGEVELQRGEGNNYNPKKGWMRGNVLIVIDRSKPEWREANPDLIEPEQRPGMLVKIWLEDVDFDLDMGRIESRGRIVVQSPDGSLEGRGLELIWNEATRQVRKLRIAHGERATIRTAGNIEFGVGVKDVVEDKSAAASKPAEERAVSAVQPSSQPAAVQPSMSRPDRLSFQKLDAREVPRLKDDRVDTYQIEFHDNVVAEQKEGVKVSGRLQGARLLRLVAEIGREERASIEHPETRPAGASSEKKPPDRTKPSREALATAAGEHAIEVRWTGELVALPLPASAAPADAAANTAAAPGKAAAAHKKAQQLHLVALGSPVEIYDHQAGSASCQELEYHAESKQVWLRGTREAPVSMSAGPERQFWGERIFVDRQLGIARVEGAGRMLDQRRPREKKLPPCVTASERKLMEESGGNISDITWTKAVHIQFGITPRDRSAPNAGAQELSGSDARQRERKQSPLGYLQYAIFEGQVVMQQDDERIAADHVEAHFLPSNDGGGESVVADRLLATGNVRLSRGSRDDAEVGTPGQRNNVVDEVSCDRLEVEMTVNDVGRNVPRIGRAIGNVYARRISGQTHREIRADSELVLTLVSVPRPVTPEEQARLHAVAQRCNWNPDSPEVKAFEANLANRRKIVASNLSAGGQVRVTMRGSDARRNVDLAADSLDCALREDEEITRALVMGTEERPATVDMGDVYVKGPRISLDMTTQSLEVPGAGRMRLVSKQDLTGRTSDKPVPVVVNWQRRMSFRGEENVAHFDGQVRAVGRNTTLDCRELRVEFENVAAEAPAATATAPWLLKPILGALRPGREPSPAGKMTQQFRKRPVYMRAHGDVVIVSTDYATAAPGTLSRMVTGLLPERLQAAASAPAEQRGPMLSRFRVAGPLVGVNLVEEHFGVEGAGNLLIEDFRLPDPRASTVRVAAPDALLDTPGTGLDSGGPSQTLFRWQNSMSYLNKRNVAAFDKEVVMDHVSGAKMVMWEELAASMKLDPRRMARIKSRQAHLTCDNLLVEFVRETSRGPDQPPLAGGMRLKSFQSTGNVLMEMDEGRQSVTGTLITFHDDSGEARVIGTHQVPAQVMMQDERTGMFRMYRAEPGDPIEWNQRTQTVRVKGGNILSTGK